MHPLSLAPRREMTAEMVSPGHQNRRVNAGRLRSALPASGPRPQMYHARGSAPPTYAIATRSPSDMRDSCTTDSPSALTREIRTVAS